MRKKKTQLIAIITDFGLTDAYVGIMKGVIFSIAPNVQVIDISHSVMPQQIDQSAYLIWSSFRWFPEGTIFLCVVDPNVGTQRKILCVETEKYYFVAPDNGILKYVLGTTKPTEIIEVSNVKYISKEISSTFNGRDIFAPVAAHLALGVKPDELGKKTTPQVGGEQFIKVIPRQTMTFHGRILHIDRFGNIVTNFLLTSDVPAIYNLQVGPITINHFYKSYTEVSTKRPFLIKGSSNLLEVSMRTNHAGNFLRTNVNQKLQLRVVADEP